MSSYLYHPFIHSFWFISLISFPGLRGLFPFTALNVHLNLAIFNHSLCVTSIGKVGKIRVRYLLVLWSIGQKRFEQFVIYLTGCGVGVSVRMWERGCLNQSETEYIQIMIPNFRRFHFLFLTESLYQKGKCKRYFWVFSNRQKWGNLLFTARMVYFFWPPPYYDATSHFARQVVKGKIAGKYSNAVNHNFFCRNPIPY